jgi:hypothetical protein
MKKILLLIVFILTLFTIPALAQQNDADSLSSDSASVYLFWEDFYEPYFSNMSPLKSILNIDLENQIITYEKYKDDLFLDFYKIQSMKEYIRYHSAQSVKKLWVEETKGSLKQKEGGYGEGLVPDIDLPKIKTPISGIIGEGGKLSVQGSEKIDFGGQKVKIYDKTHVPGESKSILPELKMNQILNVNLKGTVGQKINVFIDHNSEAESDLQNKIKLQYKGEEDEIVQLIEAGDTDLSLPGTKVIGAPPSYKGLFGIKAMGKVGPLDLTAVASKEQGESDQATFVGHSKEDTLIIHDIDYERRKFYFVDINLTENDTILKMDVYIDNRDYRDDSIAIPCEVYLNADTLDTTLSYQGMFDKQSPPSNFEWFGNVLYVKSYLEKNYVLGVGYIKKNINTNIVDTIGSFQGDTLILKLIKPENNDPAYVTWNYALRNKYYLGKSNITNPDSIKISIKKINKGGGEDSTTQNDIEYKKLLEIDKNADGFIDRKLVDNVSGYLTFPALRPFADTILTEPNPIIYDTTSASTELSKYYLEISYRGAVTSITLNQLNIIEGSEVVKVNGITLQRDVDYVIDYNIGIVEFKGNGAYLMAQPDASLTIDYQYAPFFSTASKSLVGIRGEYNLSENNKIGTSWIYRNISTYDERPKLGQEPRSVVVGEIDGTLTTEPNYLTTLCDKLPLIETEEPSRATVDGVVALSMPDPNSMGEVYIDDMEGVKQTTDIGSSMWLWHYGSVPPGKDTSTLGKYYWYQPNSEEWITRGDIFPNLPEDQKNDLASYLRVVFYPQNSDPASWMSIINLISKTGTDLTKSRFLEFWVNGTSGNIHIDIGRSMPEDIPRWTKDGSIAGFNGIIDTEDKNQDGILDSDEDTGLDGIKDGETGDDGNDNYPQVEITPSNYHQLNGTEKNDRLDSEDLDRDGSLNTSSRFVEYSVSLDNPDSNYIAEQHSNGWTLFRIPLDDTIVGQEIGEMNWEYVKYVRLWMDGFNQKDSLRFFSFEITGTTWENMDITTLDTLSGVGPDEELFVTQKNNEENPDYTPPFDPGDDQYGNPKREQSLVLQYKNVAPNHRGSVFMSIPQPGDDYTTYKNMKLYIRRKEGGSVKFYIKIGGDSTTYYQYEIDAPSQWKEITIPFKSLTDLKLEAPEDSTHFKQGNYSFQNNPSLTNVRYLELGIINETGNDITGEIWIDEIRLTSPRRDKGTSMNISGELKIADFISLNGSAGMTDADFQQLNMNKVTQSDRTNYQFNGTISLGKLFPRVWGFRIPLSHSRNKTIGYPKYKTGSDVILDHEQAKKEKSQSGSTSETISFRKESRSSHLLPKLIIDPITINATQKNSYSLTPNNMDSTALRSISGSYGFSPGVSPLRVFNLFDFFYLPNAFSTSSSYSKNRSKQFTHEESGWNMTTSNIKRYFTLSKSVQYSPIYIVSGNYSDEEIRDLDLNYENDTLPKQFGELVNLSKSFSSSFSPTLGEWLRPSFNFSTNYSEDRKPENRAMVEDSFPVRNVSNNNIISLSFDVAISKFLKLLTGIRDESKDSTAATGSPRWIIIKMEEFSNYLSRPSVTLSRSRQTSFGLLIKRPSWEYQFGLRQGIPKDIKHPNPEYYANDMRNITDNFSTSGGINTNIFSLSTTFTTSKNSNENINMVGTKNISKSTTWPNVNLQFPKLSNFIPETDILKLASGSVNYRIDRSSSERVGEGVQTESKNQTWGPSLQLTWTRDIRTNISANFSTNKSYNYESGFYETTSKTTGYNFSINYSFRAPTGLKLPLLGSRIHFSSNLNAGLDFNYSKNYSISSRFPEPTNHSINYIVSPQLSYNFSNSITGGLIGNYSMMNDVKQDRKSSTTGLDLWVEFKF